MWCNFMRTTVQGDPRSNPNHRERGLKRFPFTYQSLADALGLSLTTVRNGVPALRDALKAGDLGALVAGVVAHQEARGRPLTPKREIERLFLEASNQTSAYSLVRAKAFAQSLDAIDGKPMDQTVRLEKLREMARQIREEGSGS